LSAPALWQGSYAYNVGDVVQATIQPASGFFFRCVVAGTTGAVEPFWPTTIGNETVDGTVTWMAVTILSGDFQTANPSAIIELFELELVTAIHGSNEIYRFHPGVNLVNNGDVVWRVCLFVVPKFGYLTNLMLALMQKVEMKSISF
jgi:hypothetical protein